MFFYTLQIFATTKYAYHCDVITGNTLALHCRKAHAKINRKIENSTPPRCKIVTNEDFNLKLGTRDYSRCGRHRPCNFWVASVQ